MPSNNPHASLTIICGPHSLGAFFFLNKNIWRGGTWLQLPTCHSNSKLGKSPPFAGPVFSPIIRLPPKEGKWWTSPLQPRLAKVNKQESLSKAEPFYGQSPLAANFWLGKERASHACKKEVRVLLSRIWWPNPRCPAWCQRMPLFRRKRKRRHQKTYSSEICRLIFLLCSSKDLNEKRETWGTIFFFRS